MKYSTPSFIRFSLLLFFAAFTLPSFSQIEDPSGPNNYFSRALALEPDSFAIDKLNKTDTDFFQLNIDNCMSFRLTFVFPDSAIIPTFELRYAVFSLEDTLQPLRTGFISKSGPRFLTLNAFGKFYLKINAPLIQNLIDYRVAVIPDRTDLLECNNNPEQARRLNLPDVLDVKLNGTDLSGNPDEDWFFVEAPRCGVLSVNALGAANSQRIVLSVLNIQNQIIYRVTATEGGAPVSASAIVSEGRYLIRISDFDTCCGTGNDTVYNLLDRAFLLTVSFDSSEVAECNNSFDSAYPLPLNAPFGARLLGSNLLLEEQPWDLEYFKIDQPKCGVLNLSFSNVPNDQALEVTIFNSQKEQIDFSVAACHGCSMNMQTLTDGNPVYIKITEFDGCCTGNNAIYNLSTESFTIKASFDSSDVYECNNAFASAVSVEKSDTLLFKIYGRNSTNPLGASDRDIFKLNSASCSEVNVVIDQIPNGFDLIATVYADSLSLQNPIVSGKAKGPDSLSFSVYIPAGKGYYLVFQEEGDNNTSDRLIRAQLNRINKGPEAPVINASGSTLLCMGDSVLLKSSADYGNRWSSGDTTNSIIVYTAGVYRDTLFDNAGCFTVSEPVNISLLEAPVALFTYATDGDTVVFNNLSTYSKTFRWDFGDGETTESESPVHRYLTAGSYVVTLIVSGECGSDTLRQTILITVSLSDLQQQRVSVFPQPSCGSFQLNGLSGKDWPLAFNIWDTCGRLVFSGNIASETQRTINTDLPGGIYYLLIGRDQKIRVPLVIIAR